MNDSFLLTITELFLNNASIELGYRPKEPGEHNANTDTGILSLQRGMI
jgi:hypothetical protein